MPTGALADTFFYSSSGGRTANVKDVWPSSAPLPYLVSVPDPYDTLSPYHDWGPLRFTPAVLGRRLGARGSVVDIKTDAAASGRVRTLTVIGTKGERTITGAAARAALGCALHMVHDRHAELTPPAAPSSSARRRAWPGSRRGVRKVTLESRPYGGQWKAARAAHLAKRRGRGDPVAEGHDRLPPLDRGIRSGVVRLSVAPFVGSHHRATGSRSADWRDRCTQRSGPAAAAHGRPWATVARTTVNGDGTFSGDVELTLGRIVRVWWPKGFAIGLSKVLTVVAA